MAVSSHSFVRHLLTTRRGLAAVAAATVALAGGVTLAAPASSAPTVRAAAGTLAAKPGAIGAPITLASQVSFDGDARAYSMASDKSGTTYVAWIAASATNPTGRALHLCTLPLGATACKGGLQAVPLTDPQTTAGIRLLVTPGGAVTIVWYHTDSGGGEIAEATSQAGGPLSAEQDVATAPINGELLDAELGPDGSVWTVATGSSKSPLEVRPGVANPPETVAVPGSFLSGVGYAQLAFSGSTPIIAVGENAAITKPAAFAYRPGGSWTAFKNVAGTQTAGTGVGLVRTTSGVYLETDVTDAGYTPVIAKWNGHGFGKANPTGDTCVLGTHDLVTDASGRLVNVSDECDKLDVSSFAANGHATTLGISSMGSFAGGDPQIATVPRGYAWVVWSSYYNGSSSANGYRLRAEEIRLPGVHRTVTKRGAHGSVTVTGPASCLPAVSLSDSVKGHPKHGWRVAAHKLTLSGKKQGGSINGAALKAGASYTLKGTVVFAKGHSHSTVAASLKFRSCPNP